MPSDLPHEMQVSEVRKCLNCVRRAWDAHGPTSSIRLATPLPNGMTVSEFCFVFVVGHHTKRHIKSKRGHAREEVAAAIETAPPDA